MPLSITNSGDSGGMFLLCNQHQCSIAGNIVGRDFYADLGVERTASATTLGSAFKGLWDYTPFTFPE